MHSVLQCFCHERYVLAILYSRSLPLMFSPFIRDVVPSAPLSAATVDHACYPCTTILPASSLLFTSHIHVVAPMMSYIPHLVHVSLQLIKSLLIVPPPIVRCCVLRDVLKKYTLLSWLSVFFFLPFFVIWAVSY